MRADLWEARCPAKDNNSTVTISRRLLQLFSHLPIAPQIKKFIFVLYSKWGLVCLITKLLLKKHTCILIFQIISDPHFMVTRWHAYLGHISDQLLKIITRGLPINLRSNGSHWCFKHVSWAAILLSQQIWLIMWQGPHVHTMMEKLGEFTSGMYGRCNIYL